MQVHETKGKYLIHYMNHEVFHRIKKEGGKHISSMHIVSFMCSHKSFNSSKLIIFFPAALKKQHMRVTTNFTYSGLIARIAIARNTESIV